MPEDGCPPDTQANQRPHEKVGLSVRIPDHVAGARTVPKSGPIERDHSVILSRKIDEASRLKVLNHAAVAVKQDQRRAGSALDVMEADAVDLHEPALRGIFADSLLG
jgi:hypothetical protein